MALSPHERSRYHTDLMIACGETIRAWAVFEFTLTTYFMLLMHTTDQFRARIVWASLPNIQARRKLLTRLAANYTTGEPLRRFNVFMKRTSSLGSNRNLIAHGTNLGVNPETKKVFALSLDTGDDENGFMFLETKEIDLNSVKNWPKDIERLQKEMLEYIPDFSKAIQRETNKHLAQQDGQTP